MEIEDNNNKYPKYKLKVLKYKRKAIPSEVKNNKDISFNTNIVLITAIRKIRLYIIDKKAVNTTIPKV